ncbi:MAG: hypothetical protein QMD04_13805 [Anaerolineales bacterium]|nr:hypothetical protein [Anaerolineales bacterium]
MDIELPLDFKEFLKLLKEKFDLPELSPDPFLKENKKAAGRFKDLADLENLP